MSDAPPANGRGPKIMLYGPTGTGKTHAIRSLVELGFKVFALTTEPGIEDVCGDLPPDKLHWHFVPAVPASAAALQKAAQDFSNLSYKALAESTPNRAEFKQWLALSAALVNLKCDRTGESFGDPASWGSDWVFFFDSLTGLIQVATGAWVGSKPVLAPSDYQVIQKHVKDFLDRFCMAYRCWVVVTAHPEREQDELSQLKQIRPVTLGKALAPSLPNFFSEMIYTVRSTVSDAKGARVEFRWSNLEPNAQCKARLLPWSDRLDPDFKLLYEQWRKRSALSAPQPAGPAGTK